MVAVHEKDRVRALAFRILAEDIMEYSRDGSTDEDNVDLSCTSVIRRFIFPAISQTICATTPKPSIISAAVETLRAIHAIALSQDEDVCTWTDDKRLRSELAKHLVK